MVRSVNIYKRSKGKGYDLPLRQATEFIVNRYIGSGLKKITQNKYIKMNFIWETALKCNWKNLYGLEKGSYIHSGVYDHHIYMRGKLEKKKYTKNDRRRY